MSSNLVWEQDGKDWPHRAASRFVEASGLRWHVQVTGSGPALLLLHGTGASTHSWRDMIPVLERHFTMVVPDLPGHGFTEFPASERLSLEGMAQAIQALLRRMAYQPSVVIGHSAGAAIAVQMALNSAEPPKALVGINAALMPFGGMAGHFFPVMARMLVLNPFVPRFFAWRATDPQAVNRLIAGTGSKLDEAGLQFYRKLFASRSHVAATLGMMAQWSLDRLIRDMTKLTLPALLVVGEADKAVPPEDARRIRKIIPDCSLETVPRTGHLCHEEQPEKVAGLILNWLSALPAIDVDLNAHDAPTQRKRAS